MNLNMNGRSIAAIYFEGGVGCYSGNPEMIRENGDLTLHLSATFHGNHEQYWVIEAVKGTEFRRHNVGSIATIEWRSVSENDG